MKENDSLISPAYFHVSGIDVTQPGVIDALVEQYKQQSEPLPADALPLKAALELEIEARIASQLQPTTGPSARARQRFHSELAQFYLDYMDASGASEGSYVTDNGTRRKFERPLPTSRPFLLSTESLAMPAVLRCVRDVDARVAERLASFGVVQPQEGEAWSPHQRELLQQACAAFENASPDYVCDFMLLLVRHILLTSLADITGASGCCTCCLQHHYL